MEKIKRTTTVLPLALSALIGYLFSSAVTTISSIFVLFPEAITDVIKIIVGFAAGATSLIFLIKKFSTKKTCSGKE